MRVGGGDYKGRRLFAPNGEETRPTADAQREAIFNILHNSYGHQSEKVLDLFAGTGALAIEALSWGASHAVFVESSKKALQCLQKNLDLCRVESSKVHCIEKDKIEQWPRILCELEESFRPFDTIFCDPPYKKGLVGKTLNLLEKYAPKLFLEGQSILIVETSTDEALPNLVSSWRLLKDRSKGSTRLLFYKREQD
jgi:16S rRNA (guanine966-N2)-methyltransferase